MLVKIRYLDDAFIILYGNFFNLSEVYTTLLLYLVISQHKRIFYYYLNCNLYSLINFSASFLLWSLQPLVTASYVFKSKE